MNNKGGVISVSKASGDIYFIDQNGKDVLKPRKNVEIRLGQDFPGLTLEDALHEAKKYAIGALKAKMSQDVRHECSMKVDKLRLNYSVKYGLGKKPPRVV
jgi:hypothetical protein